MIEQIGDGADRRKRRIEVLRRHLEESGGNGRTLYELKRYCIKNFGLTRKSSERLIEDMEFCGITRERRGRIYLRKRPP